MATTESIEQRYAVFGHPIAHSLSPRIHTLFAAQTEQHTMSYTAVDVSEDQFETAINDFYQQGGLGLNCTVPLKLLAFQRADLLSQRAQRCGAVNTLSFKGDGTILGDNTDGVGLLRDITHNQNVPIRDTKLLILGAGGATRGILEPLLQEDPQQIVIANRTVEKALSLAELFNDLGNVIGCGYDALDGQSFDLIINATAASLHNQLPPLPDTALKPNGNCYDLAYGAQPTPFVKWGQQHGATISVDGLGMLIEQAAEAFLIWRGVRPNTQSMIQDDSFRHN
jgi:shikimate dehydrogenase